MKTKLKTILNNMENKNYKVVEVNNKEFKLDNGDVYPHNFDLDESITVEEFQILLNKSKASIIELIKNISK